MIPPVCCPNFKVVSCPEQCPAFYHFRKTHRFVPSSVKESVSHHNVLSTAKSIEELSIRSLALHTAYGSKTNYLSPSTSGVFSVVERRAKQCRLFSSISGSFPTKCQ